MKSRITAPIVLAFVVLAFPALTGCSLIQGQVEGVVEQATGTDIDLPSSEVPEDFPAEVPLYDGEIANTIALGTGDEKVYSISVRVPGVETMDEIAADFEAAGFESTLSGNTGDGATAAFDNGTWSAVVVVVAEGDTGWIAQYAVSRTAQ